MSALLTKTTLAQSDLSNSERDWVVKCERETQHACVVIHGRSDKDSDSSSDHPDHPDRTGSGGQSEPARPQSEFLQKAERETTSFTTAYGAHGSFTQEVIRSRGELSFSIRERFSYEGNRDTFFVNGSNGSGHHYWVFSSLGRNTAMSPAQIMFVIQQHLNFIFPLSPTDDNGQPVWALTLNQTVHLAAGGDNEVEVTEMTPYTFKFTAKPNHWLQGSAVHGVFRDKSGEVWLFQEGTGVPAEGRIKRNINAWIAWELWPQMGQRVKQNVIEGGPKRSSD
jgi:hypothetical protein